MDLRRERGRERERAGKPERDDFIEMYDRWRAFVCGGQEPFVKSGMLAEGDSFYGDCFFFFFILFYVAGM